MQNDPIVIVGIARTPQGNLLGELKDFSAPQLGAIAIQSALHRAHVNAEDVDEVIMGCVLPAGLGQAPARQSALLAQIQSDVPCTTINKMCGSGMKAVMLACNTLMAESHKKIIVAGGMESMTNAPYLIPKARQGYRLGHSEILDHMMVDGLEDAYEKRRPMGYFAELCAEKYQISRAEQDDYAIESLQRAQQSIHDHTFESEIAPITLKTKQGEKIITNDEHPLSVKIEKVKQLAPIFKKDGTVTAANSCSISDGAAALVLMHLSEAQKRNLKPLAKILDYSEHAKPPEEFTTAPIDAIKKLMHKLNWTVDQVDLFEINEAFSVVPIAAMRELHIPREKINVHGGGCGLGHPIGATGARIIVTLVAALKHHHLKYGIASLCIGGGEATAIALENME
ncbi:MAG TPA: acetyl-CoA C-acyltransferase [Gammaproteobacteria bacterium]|jgi:acetyl-CoA C-acetyltransferase|nr:acetyl-CoA C-acyltransferase [Gammaproteobacteria bacterium]